MKKLLLIGSLVAATGATAAAAPALADTRCINPQTNTATGALVGAAGGAAAGSLLAGRHNRGEGAILGAVGGALIGGAIGHNQVKCPDGYYAYDDQTRQYYDNNGSVYAPQGGPGPGYGGGPPPGGPGYGPPPPGGGYGPPPPQGAYGGPPPGGGYGGDWWANAPTSTGQRISYLRDRIQQAADSGRIGNHDARRSFADMDDIQRQYYRLRNRDGGHLNGADRDYIQSRLDRARAILHEDVRNNY